MHRINGYLNMGIISKPIIVFFAVIFLCNCHSSSSADSIAFKNISSVYPDTNRIKPENEPSINIVHKGTPVPLKNMFGVNGYEWNFLENPGSPHDRNHIYEDNMKLIKSFTAVRHYLNWNRLEDRPGNYSFNPAMNGGWDYDIIYQRCKQDSILVLADLKNTVDWLVATYPASSRDNDGPPVPYRKTLDEPSSYTDQARMAFQFAARYGYNKHIDSALVKVDKHKRWPGDVPNVVKIGLGLIKYIECGNERDRWWGEDETHMTAEQYAANMSAFYDGDMGKLGPGVGVKTADPTMKVVMGGLASASVKFIQGMVDWCKTHRGYKQDGSINLCFDIINYHLYSNNGDVRVHTHPTTGIAPELSNAGSIANSFETLANSLKQHPDVWVTENGYDINQESYQKAESIGKKTVLESQGDWILRSSLLYIRCGIKRLFFYQLFDDHAGGTTQYATSGLAEGLKRRPAADYILQTNKLMGSYNYVETINKDPLVDIYKLGKKTMYVLTVPDETGRSGSYSLKLGTAKANVFNLKAGADSMTKQIINTVKGTLKITATETPVFVQALN